MLKNIGLKFLVENQKFVHSTFRPLFSCTAPGVCWPTYYDNNLIILNSAYAANMAAAFSIYDKHLR
jgi:hypothetical protein